ncbi:hypothetical protein ARMA_2015 [Ardenticatena maritima]|uniref:Thioredoxin domain-containing protein n=1 Tax=Ardenticatena maritima TaxID=872965 RepID=A0A0M8K9P0_9CHLR|nr:TlpA disulfide reductase family protein [Ardenticatena maritima]KPL87090.1 hypothetical protein SE16_11040 [Ardenticatena maritima]GAP63592.1 hypothetical protein ARMA_2015 [Ardenticatena maritima]
MDVREGDLAPPFHALKTLNGAPLQVDDLRGAPALLLFFHVGCAGCMGRALPLTLRLAREYPQLRLVGIHLTGDDEPERVEYSLQKVIDYFKLPYPIIMDDGDATFRAYGVSGTPHWVLLNADGTIRKHFFGSMEGAQQRLFYSLAELFDSPPSEPN